MRLPRSISELRRRWTGRQKRVQELKTDIVFESGRICRMHCSKKVAVQLPKRKRTPARTIFFFFISLALNLFNGMYLCMNFFFISSHLFSVFLFAHRAALYRSWTPTQSTHARADRSTEQITIKKGNVRQLTSIRSRVTKEKMRVTQISTCRKDIVRDVNSRNLRSQSEHSYGE